MATPTLLDSPTVTKTTTRTVRKGRRLPEEKNKKTQPKKDPKLPPTPVPTSRPTRAPSPTVPPTTSPSPTNDATTPVPSPRPTTATPSTAPSAAPSFSEKPLFLGVSVAVQSPAANRHGRNLVASLQSFVAWTTSYILQTTTPFQVHHDFNSTDHRRLGQGRAVTTTLQHHPEHRRRHLIDEVTLQYKEEESSVQNVFFQADTSWWKHTVAYNVLPSVSLETYNGIKQEATEALEASLENGVFLELLQELTRGDSHGRPTVVAVALPGDELSTPLVDPNESESPQEKEKGTITTKQQPTYSEGLNVKEWDVRRWVGVGVAGMTLLGLAVAWKVARRRRKTNQQQELWGAFLQTETDVNNWLSVPWPLDDKELPGGPHKEGEESIPDSSLLRHAMTTTPSTEGTG